MTGSTDRVFDVGLQAERTALAWQRTALVMAVAAVGSGRLAAPALGGLAYGLAAAGLVQAVTVSFAAQRRYRRVHRSLTSHGDLAAGGLGAAQGLATAVSGLTVALLALLFVLHSVGR